MKIIVISLLLLTIASAFLPENQLLESKHEDPTINILEIVEESNIEEKFEPRPRLQRQNAIRFPLSDSEEQINEESNKIDSFEADKSYYYGLNSSFSDLYNDWKNTNANTEDTNKVKNSIKESFEKVELALENIFDIVETGLFELSQEAEEKQTILGVDKATFHEKVKEMTTNFDEMLDEIYQVVTQISDQSASDQILSSIDKDSARETLNNLAENADEVFDEVLLALAQLSKEDSSIKTLFGFDKADIKQFVNLAESQFEIIIKDPSSLLEELFGQDMKKKSLSDSDLSTDESDADTTHFNELNSTIESLNEDEVELEEVLLELRKIFNETIEEQALYGSNLSIKINSDESDSSNVDNTYFNGLDSTADLPRDSEMNFEKLLIALQGLLEDAIEKEKASEPELIDE